MPRLHTPLAQLVGVEQSAKEHGRQQQRRLPQHRVCGRHTRGALLRLRMRAGDEAIDERLAPALHLRGTLIALGRKRTRGQAHGHEQRALCARQRPHRGAGRLEGEVGVVQPARPALGVFDRLAVGMDTRRPAAARPEHVQHHRLRQRLRSDVVLQRSALQPGNRAATEQLGQCVRLRGQPLAQRLQLELQRRRAAARDPLPGTWHRCGVGMGTGAVAHIGSSSAAPRRRVIRAKRLCTGRTAHSCSNVSSTPHSGSSSMLKLALEAGSQGCSPRLACPSHASTASAAPHARAARCAAAPVRG